MSVAESMRGPPSALSHYKYFSSVGHGTFENATAYVDAGGKNAAKFNV